MERGGEGKKKEEKKKKKKENKDNIQHILFGLLAKSVPKQKNPDAELRCYKFSHIPFMTFVHIGLS